MSHLFLKIPEMPTCSLIYAQGNLHVGWNAIIFILNKGRFMEAMSACNTQLTQEVAEDLSKFRPTSLGKECLIRKLLDTGHTLRASMYLGLFKILKRVNQARNADNFRTPKNTHLQLLKIRSCYSRPL